MKRIVAIVLVFATMLCLSGCGIREFLSTLGFDTHDYEGERVIKNHKEDSEVAAELCDMVKILTMNTVDIPEFNGTKEAVESCRDAVLNSMYTRNFAKYAGNSYLIEKAKSFYPQVDFSVIIPAGDFENIAYKYFGGKEKIANKSGKIFDYIEDIDSYITVSKPVDSTMEVSVQSIEETERTYRFRFSCSVEGESSDVYFALIVKRGDDSLYFKYIKKQ